MKITKLLTSAILAMAVTFTTSAWAVSITPDYDSFGSLPAATWGGSGIPNHSVAISTSGGVTLGLQGHQRLTGPDLIDDNAGTYDAIPGPGTAAHLSTWNFALYGKLDANSAAGSTWRLFYDFDPAVGNDQSSLGYINLGLLGPTAAQDSQNLGFAYLDSGIPSFVIPPTYASFDPNALGEYSFVLEAYSPAGAVIGRSAINVNTGRSSVPDTGSNLTMLGMGVAGLVVFKRRGVLSVA